MSSEKKSPEKNPLPQSFLFLPLDSYTSASYEAQKKYLQAIKNLEPGVLSSLAQDVLPLYRSLYRPDFYREQDYLMSKSVLFNLTSLAGLDGKPKERHELLDTWRYEFVFMGEGIVFLPEGILPQNQVIHQLDFLYPRRSQELFEYISRWKKYCASHYAEIMKVWDSKALIQLVEALVSWSRKWRVSYQRLDWHIDHALQTLNSWCRSEIDNDLDWLYSLKGTLIKGLDPDNSFVFWFPACDLQTDTWENYEQKLNEMYDEVKLDYSTKVQRIALARQQKLAITKYNQEHFDWLVRFQMQGWSKNKIATHYNVDRKAVRYALTTTADLVRIRLRD